jgi:predicted membrane channel-forming protein YqfA (hemolysin III family)
VHGAGLLLALAGALPLLRRAHELGGHSSLLWAVASYLAGLIGFFASSTLRHSLYLTDASIVLKVRGGWAATAPL